MFSLKKKTSIMISFLVLFNLITWILFFAITKFDPSLLGLGALAYFFGLRHAFDADHIAAIDNVTRKLRQDNQKPVTVGLFFSLGHSTVVLLVSLAVVLSTRTILPHMQFFKNIGGAFGTVVSASFLTLIGVINFVILIELYKLFKSYRNSENHKELADQTLDNLLNKRGFLSRFFRFAYRHINTSYKMYPLGFLFGLGFDTATEIAILGISAALAKSSALPVWGVLIFPLLFAAGMSLMDGLDGLIMMKIYDWAMIDVKRKLFFNVIITGTSVFIALAVGMVEWMQVMSMELNVDTPFFNFLNSLNFEVLGVFIVFIMVISWVSAFFYYKKVLVRQNSFK